MYERKDYSHEILRNKYFSGRVLKGVDFSFSYLENCNFKGCRLINCDFTGSIIKNCCFDCCYMDCTYFCMFDGWSQEECDKCRAEGKTYKATIVNCEISNTDFRRCVIWGGGFDWAKCYNLDLSGSYIIDARIESEWNFSRFVSTKILCNYSNGALFNYCKFIGTHFCSVFMEFCNFQGSIFKDIKSYGDIPCGSYFDKSAEFLTVYMSGAASDNSLNDENIFLSQWEIAPHRPRWRRNIVNFGTTKWRREIEHLERNYKRFKAENPLPRVSKKLKVRVSCITSPPLESEYYDCDEEVHKMSIIKMIIDDRMNSIKCNSCGSRHHYNYIGNCFVCGAPTCNDCLENVNGMPVCPKCYKKGAYRKFK